jgi:hypothetical protein
LQTQAEEDVYIRQAKLGQISWSPLFLYTTLTMYSTVQAFGKIPDLSNFAVYWVKSMERGLGECIV